MEPAETLITPGYEPGTVIRNRYELLRPLGAGGMGVVWLTHDRVLNVEVALKLVLLPECEANARAQTEARAAARLAHPAVCRVTDYGRTERGDPFVVTELLTGETLDDLLNRRGRLPAPEAVQILLPILDALEAAHAAGIVHRDVKPSNIFLTHLGNRDVQPKLLDFGIARWLDENTRSTATGAIVGTPDYMSPEQARGSRDVGTPSDIWSFCATLYETLTGWSPFLGDNYNSVLYAILNSEPLPITAHTVGDAALADIVARGLRRDCTERWGSAAELAGELSRWLVAQGLDTDVCDHALRPRMLPRTSWVASLMTKPASLPSRIAETVRVARANATEARPSPLSRALSTVAMAVLGLVAVASSAYAIKRAAVPPTAVLIAPADERREEPQPSPSTEQSATPVASAPTVRPVAGRHARQAPSASTSASRNQTTTREPPPEEPAEPPPAAPSATTAPDSTAKPPPRPEPPRRAPARRTNALGYDFGL